MKTGFDFFIVFDLRWKIVIKKNVFAVFEDGNFWGFFLEDLEIRNRIQ